MTTPPPDPTKGGQGDHPPLFLCFNLSRKVTTPPSLSIPFSSGHHHPPPLSEQGGVGRPPPPSFVETQTLLLLCHVTNPLLQTFPLYRLGGPSEQLGDCGPIVLSRLW